MSDNNTPELPEIPELTQEQLNRLLAADWLQSLAILIRQGRVQGFNLAWDARVNKPIGPVQIEANLLHSPLELKVAQVLQAQPAPVQETREIIYEDRTEDLKDHQCDNPACLVCNNPNEA